MLARSKRNADPQGGNAKRSNSSRPEEGEETRVLISNQVAGIIIGKKGTKVASIREQAGVSLTILSSEGGGATDRIMVIQGPAENRAKSLHLVAQLIADSETKQGEKVSNDIQLLIHKVYAGAIIGKQGATIKQIKTATGAAVKISNDCLGDSTEKTCTISGAPDQIFDAVIMILEKIAENPLREGTTHVHYLGTNQTSAPNPFAPAQVAQAAAAYAALAPGGAYNQLAAYLTAAYTGANPAGLLGGAAGGEKRTDRVNIPTKMAGAVIGQGGAAIRSISAQSGCTISIADADSSDPDVRTISVTGTTQGIQAALALIHQRVDSAGQPGGSPGFGATAYPSYSPFPLPTLPTTFPQPTRGAIGQPTFTKLVQPPITDPSLLKTERVPIASNRAGALIGKQGSTMKQITALSGCAISIGDAEETNPEERVITIKGTDLAVQYAIILIRQRLESDAAAQTAAASSTKMDLSFPEETQTATLAIPSATAGAVIGKSGATIASIKQQSGCSISIADAVGDSSERMVTVTGSSSGIQTATNLIQQKVSSYVPKHADRKSVV